MNPKVRLHDIVVQKSGEETLVYDLAEDKAYCLNESSTLVYDLCDGKQSAADIRDELSKKLETLISDDFVNLALDQLGKDGLLEGSTEEYFNSISRRQVIRKIGITSAALLPMISLIVAPSAASAQSCFTNGTLIPFPFMNPSTQADNPACLVNCFFPGNPANPDPSCCSGNGRSPSVLFNIGTGDCTCTTYRCAA